MKTVKSYTEYTRLLMRTFGDIDRMPERRDIQSFIDAHSLYVDWGIEVPDVMQDLRAQVLERKGSTDPIGKKRISSYRQYLEILLETFGDIDRMPERRDIQSFIDAHSLYVDWGIEVPDVMQDFRAQTLERKCPTDAFGKKRISSYRQYLEILLKTFGIPETMPEPSRISEFIDEYELFHIWGITEDDVSKDLQGFIDGKYSEMYREAAPVRKKTVSIVKRPFTSLTITDHTSYYTNRHLLSTRADISSLAKHVKPDRNKLPKPKKNGKKKTAVKSKLEKHMTIFIDGDNHINEGSKGIENLPKGITVKAFFSQKGAKKKFDKKYENRPNVLSKSVKKGEQAVDNQIKAQAGQLLKKGNQDIIIVSQDKGFVKYSNRKMNEKDGNNISVAKSVKEGVGEKHT